MNGPELALRLLLAIAFVNIVAANIFIWYSAPVFARIALKITFFALSIVGILVFAAMLMGTTEEVQEVSEAVVVGTDSEIVPEDHIEV